MSPEQWNKVADLFQAARERAGRERTALLDSACSDDSSLRVLVEQMLQNDEATGSFLNGCLLPALAVPGSDSNGASSIRLIPGLKVGRYEIVAPIGRGGMGEVWMGHDPELDRSVALKFLAPEAVFGGAAERLIVEARAASALNHPNIVTVHEVIRHEETSIIVMELVEGITLRALCGSPQPLEQVISLGLQIARALATAHAHGIVHRDVKPENILVRRDGYVKVVDFGLASRTKSEEIASSPRISAGTLRYMSPEQARGEPTCPATDIFAFGLVLHELATGQHAFRSDSPFGVVHAMLTAEPLAPSSVNRLVPARLNSLILTMLAKDRGDRPEAEEVSRTLAELQRPREIPSTLSRGVWKWVAAVAIIAAGFAVLRSNESRKPASTATFRQITTLVPENRATAAAISPDGKLTAYANVDGIFVRETEGGQPKAVPMPSHFTVDRIAWFPDERKIAVSGFSNLTYVPSIWIVSLAGTEPHLLRQHAREATPSPDGTRIVFVSQDWSQIWVIGANGAEPRRILAGPVKDRFPIVLWSPDGQRLTFQWRHVSSAKHTISYDSVLIASGRIEPIERDLRMSSAATLPDGRVAFLRWDSADLTSSRQLWELKINPATGTLVRKPRKIAILPGDNTTLLDLSITRDGKRAMVLRRSDQDSVFVGDFDALSQRISNVRRLTLDESLNYPHAWTADSRAVIFESNRNGNFDLFKQDIDRDTPDSIVATPLTEILAQRSPDGRFILYAARPPEDQKPWFYKPRTYRLMRVPVGGGTAQEVPIGGMLDEFRCALGRGKPCVLRTTVPGQYRTYYDLDPIRGKGRELARIKWSYELLGDWDISPDGKYVAIPNHNSDVARIRIVALDPGPNEPRERQMVLAGVTDLRGLVWSAHGRGWFVSVDTTVGRRMLYVSLDGRYHSLGDIQGWAVPSSDGRHVAFLDRIAATNAWLIALQR